MYNTYSQCNAVFTIHPFCLYNKVKVKFEYRIGEKYSLGSFGDYHFGKYFYGYKFEPFIRQYFNSFPLDGYLQYSLFYGNFLGYFDYNTINSESVLRKTKFNSFGIGLGFGKQWLSDDEIVTDWFIGIRFCTFPVVKSMNVNYVTYELSMTNGYNFFYRSLGPGAILVLNLGFSFGKNLKSEINHHD